MYREVYTVYMCVQLVQIFELLKAGVYRCIRRCIYTCVYTQLVQVFELL